ncbi:MAG: hypothetical protein HYY55_02870 [Candidatus Niyogibacteria bacterium]|nr:MAG: hypothetical protein HYY55_02870 [Candidatus Niyogibacteria bacterium]
MPRKRLPKSIRKFIRMEKAKIRRRILDLDKQKEEIGELYQKVKEAGYNKNNKLSTKVEAS